MVKIKIKKVSLLLISFISNAYLLKGMLPSSLPDLTFAIYAVLYLLTLIYLIKNNKNDTKIMQKMDIGFSIWVLIYLISVLYSPYPSAGIYKLSKLCFMALALVFFIRVYVNNKKDFDYLLNCYVLTAFLIELIVIQNFVSLGMPFGRFIFYGAHPIPLGMLGTVTAIVVICQFLSKKIAFFKFFVVLITSAWIVLISSSKGPLIAFLVGLLILFPSIFSSFKKGISFTLLGTIVYFFVSQTSQFKQMMFRLTYTSQDQSTFDRLNLYSMAESIFNSHPFLGGGVGVFNDIYPHDIFMEVFAEGGLLLGVFLCLFFCWVIFKYVVYVFKNKKNFYYFTGLAILISSLTVLMVSYTYVDLKFLYFGLGLLLIQKSLKDGDKNVFESEIEKTRQKKRLIKSIKSYGIKYKKNHQEGLLIK